ncbi:MAG: preprotein translocase subunit SecY [Bacillota bacterium]
MLATIRQAFRIPDLRKRIYFTLWMFLIYRIGALVPVPGINREALQGLFREGSLFNFLDMFSGGALRNFSIFALNVQPYITASIIIQLLTMIIPKWEEMAKEGQEGRRKLQQYTRFGTVFLGFIQAYAMAVSFGTAITNPSPASFFVIALTMTAGVTFVMWLGEQITEKGIGNGISLIIFASIVSRLPVGAVQLFDLLKAGRINIFNVLVMAVLGLLAIAGIVWVTQGQRRIPVQYAKRVVGRKLYGGQSTHIPIRVNQAGVIPVIFASSVLAFPVTIAQFVKHPIATWFQQVLGFQTPAYLILNLILIVAFTYFYTAMTFNPKEIAANMQKYSGFIPGLRPGKPTADYLQRVMSRITLLGALFLGFVWAMPVMFIRVTNIPGLSFGGTALLIVVGVALETMKQIESHLVMRQYQGFLK